MAKSIVEHNFLTSTSSSTEELGTSYNASARYGGMVIATVTNGATPPTEGCLVELQVSGDGSAPWDTIQWVRAGNEASATNVIPFPCSLATPYVRVKFGSTSQSITKIAVGYFASIT